jgi:hypothetical protein
MTRDESFKVRDIVARDQGGVGLEIVGQIAGVLYIHRSLNYPRVSHGLSSEAQTVPLRKNTAAAIVIQAG